MKKKTRIVLESNLVKDMLFWAMFTMLMLLFAFICLYRLGEGTVRDWDEARHGVNAYEMVKNNEWIVTTYGNEIDYWNLKPPLSEWMIALGYLVFGFNLFGMRIYSAVSMILTALICGLFAYKSNGKISAIVTLVCFSGTTPLLFQHCARTGDADSLYILFHMIAVLALCSYLRRGVGLYLSCLCFSFAFLTKSWHAGCIGIIVLTCLILTKRIFRFKVKNWILCVISALGPIMLWAAARASKDGTAFFEGMLELDLLERSTTVLVGTAGEVTYYFRHLWNSRIFIPLVMMAAFAVPLLTDKKKRGIIGVLGLAVLLPLLAFSLAKSKLHWYILCIYPPLILLAAFGVQEIIKNAKKYWIGLVCVFISMFIVFFCVKKNVMTVRDGIGLERSAADALFSLVSREEEFSGAEIYINVHEGTGDWSQSEFLAAELAGDMVPQNGGMDDWYADRTAYLLTLTEYLPPMEGDYVVVSEDGTYCIVAHAAD